MKRYDYFIQSLKAKAHYSREWMLRAFTVVLDEPKGQLEWSLKHTDEAVLVYVPSGDGWRWEVLEGAKPYQIPYIYHESAGPIKAGDVENLKKDLPDVTWGQILFNSRTLVYACGDLIDYVEGDMISHADIEKIFVSRMQSDPLPGEPYEPGVLYVKHWVRFGKAVGDLATYEFFIPSVTEHALQPPPERDKLRAELLEKYKDELEDPVIQVKIQNELVKAYKEHLKGDPSEGFIYSNKSIGTALKRMFLIHGPEAGFSEGGRAELVVNSLQEGLDISKYPAMVNSLRAGSYYRGAMTKDTGEDVNLMSRVFQNARIQPEFCGTTETLKKVITDAHIDRYVQDGKEMVKITPENLDKYKGKKMGLYSPIYCKTPRGDVCSVCIGAKIAAYPNSLGSMVVAVASKMFDLMMASAHAKELKTTKIDMHDFLR